jgi:glucose/arabinose dehydrogenase
MLALLALTLAACGGGGEAPAPAPPPPAAPGPAPTPRMATVASGLASPWGLAFLPDGSLLVTEKGGSLRRVVGGVVQPPIAGVPAVDAGGQGGLLDVLVAPDFTSSRRIWLAYAERGTGAESGRNGLAVATAQLSADSAGLQGLRVIWRQAPKVSSSGHFGGRLAWRGDGTIFVTLGDRQNDSERAKAQDLGQGHGKVMRIDALSGAAPADNPFVGRAGAQPEIWSLGHRNVQGATLHPTSGELWATEHGPQGGDELNRVRAGLNYGWPRVSHGCEYGTPIGNCTPVGGASSGPGFEDPLTVWVPTSVAPSGLAFYTGDRFPQWRGQLFMGALAGRALWRIELNGNTVASREALFTNLNERIRDVRQGPDGWLYLLTDGAGGKVLRVES